MSGGRNTTTRDKHRAIIAKDKPPCYHCGKEILYDAHHRDPLSFQVDHYTPLSKGGSDTLDNCVPSHRACNREKSDSVAHQPGVTFITERCWWKPNAEVSHGMP